MVGHFKVVITGGKVKRSRVPACTVSAVDVVLPGKLVAGLLSIMYKNVFFEDFVLSRVPHSPV